MPGPVRFIKSAVLPKDYPIGKKVEVAIAGRSNAGKSSLINVMATSKIAKVSSTPGKTRLLNFFDMWGKYILVDMPGYGFAARAGKEVTDWQNMIESYLLGREQLCGLILVMDIRRDWAAEEQMIKKFSDMAGFPMMVVLTKADKLNKSQIEQARRKIVRSSCLEDVFVVSALKKQGHQELEEYIYDSWVKPFAEHLKNKSETPE